MPDFWEVVLNRYSCRSFRPDPIPAEDLMRIIDAARWAPSGGNTQPWKFYVVTNSQLRKKLTSCTFSGANSSIDKPQYWLGQAPVQIVVCRDWQRSAERYDRLGSGFVSYQDCAAATENMLLAAQACGLGACWVASFRILDVMRALDISPEFEPVAMIALGYPASPPGPRRPRRPFEELVAVKN